MRTLVQHIDVTCDICRLDGNNTETPADEADAITFEISGRAKRVDVCAEHKDPTWSAIMYAMTDDIDPARGRVTHIIGRTTSATGGFPCPVPDCPGPRKPLTTAVSVSRHLARMHADIPIEERTAMYRAIAGDDAISVSTSLRQAQLRSDTTCPICGTKANGPIGLRMHIVIKHKNVSASEREVMVAAVPE